ncbi:MAG: PqqD family protein, partial [Thermoproteota archaeon]
MPLLRKKEEEPRISLERLHGSIPVIHPELKQEENSEGIITILIPIKDKSGRIIRTAKINLDLIGSKIWKKIDGKTTFSEISQWMKKEFVITEKEAEVSLSMFIKSLIDKRLIALILPPPKPGTPEVEEEIKRIK